MTNKSILFVVPWLPYPLKSGGHQALFNGICAVKDDFDVHIAFVVNNYKSYIESEREFLKLIPSAHLHPLVNEPSLSLLHKISPFIRRILRNIQGIFGQREDKGLEMCSRWLSSISPLHFTWVNHISALCKEYHFDIIQVEMPWLVSQILTLPQESKRIFVHHELGFVCRELEQQQLDKNEYINACRAYADMVEICLLNSYDAIVTLSSIDKNKLLSHGVSVPVYSSFATINIRNEFESIACDGKVLSFIGPDSHFPNLVGITWFLENCWGKLKNESNDYKLKIIGKWDDKKALEYSSTYPGVEFLGFVDNLEDAIKGTIMIVPITIGSGIRMKILEACSIGVPFVSTAVGAEGIPVVNGEHCFIANSPYEFVNALVNLRQKDLQEKFVVQSHKMLEQNYSQDALRKNRQNIYRDILHY